LTKEVSLRKFPYPYRAALAICSDIDSSEFLDFIEIHKYLNTRRRTSLGEGLGLEIGDSFWMYSNEQTRDHAFAYFDPSMVKPSKYSGAMRELIGSGYIDVMHTYGNFSVSGGFIRELAERALEELEKHNLKIEVWSNHGDEKNLQNIGGSSKGLGDVKYLKGNEGKTVENKRYYHTDLLINYGIKYYWDSEESLTHVIGQDRNCSFYECLVPSIVVKAPRDRLRNMVKAGFSPITRSMVRRTYLLSLKENRLSRTNTLRDDNKIIKFTRYGLGGYDWSEDVPLILSDKVLRQLINVEGYCIAYVHLGDRRNNRNGLPLSYSTLAAFEKMAKYYYEGKLLITTTRNLLRFRNISKELIWSYSLHEGSIRIFIDGVAPSILSYGRVNLKDLQGLTFYTPDPSHTEVFLKGKKVKVQENRKDHRNKLSVSIPRKRLSFPL